MLILECPDKFCHFRFTIKDTVPIRTKIMCPRCFKHFILKHINEEDE